MCAALPGHAAQFIVSDRSSVNLTRITGGGADVVENLAPGLVGESFILEDPRDSHTFSFLEFTVDCNDAWGCLGVGTYDITATLAFDLPAISVEGNGSGSALLAVGKIVGGNLTWTDVPKTVSFGNGQTATIDFEDAFGLVLGKKVTTAATVTLGASPVPLPAAGLMLGVVLTGMGYAASRRRQA